MKSEWTREWIPTKVALPNDGTYLVTGKQKYEWEAAWDYFVDIGYCPGTYIDDHWDTVNDWIEGQETHIIAWMPLPDPYKEKDNAEDNH